MVDDPKTKKPEAPIEIWRPISQEFTDEDFKTLAASRGVPVEGTQFDLEDETRNGAPGRKIVIVD